MITDRRLDDLPRLEHYAHSAPAEPVSRSVRARLFLLVSGLVLALGCAWTAFQPPVYRSSATVLMSAPGAIDAAIAEADIESVAIQRRILLGGEITERLLQELEMEQLLKLDRSELRALLQVNPVPETNLVEMIAQGPDSEFLPLLVNTWIDVYLSVRAEDIEQRKHRTTRIVEEELDGLAVRLEQARTALEGYRQEHDIISVERQENAVLARLDGLNSALNAAIEEEVKTGAYLDTLRDAITAGEQVVAQSERRSVENKASELRKLQVQLQELSKRYTMDYINKQPRYREIPQRIEQLEADLAQALVQGREQELANAIQAHAAAEQAVRDLQLKLEDHKQQVAQFNTMYATHQSLAEDLARLEAMHRDTQARLVQVEVRQVEKYPQVAVIDRPAPQSERIGPNYLVLLGGTLGAAIALGIFSVWLLGFLSPKIAQPGYVTLSGVHMYPQQVGGELAYTTQPDPRLAQGGSPRLEEHKNETGEEPDRDINDGDDKPG